MATEYGLFNDEGCFERGFWSAEAAQVAMDDHQLEEPDEDVYFTAMCEEHDEQPADHCDVCWADDDEEEEED